MLAITVRHTKNQVINGRKILELPPKHEEKIEVELSAAERAKYRELHAEAKRTFEQTYAARGEAYLSSKILSIMALLLPLRRLCSGGYLTAADLAGADGRRVVVGGGGGARVGAEVGAGNGPLGVGVKADPNAGPKADPGANCDAPAPPALEGDAKPVLPVADAEASDKACGICHELCDAPLRTGCNHFFCSECLKETASTVAAIAAAGRGGAWSRTRTPPGRTRTRRRRDEMRLSAAGAARPSTSRSSWMVVSIRALVVAGLVVAAAVAVEAEAEDAVAVAVAVSASTTTPPPMKDKSSVTLTRTTNLSIPLLPRILRRMW